MSFDPFASESALPPDYGAAAPMSGEPTAYGRQRVQAPAIALIVVAILNLLGTGWIFFNVASMALTPANRLHEQMLDVYQSFPEMKAELNKKSPDELKNQILLMGWGWVALGLLTAALTLAGGVRMLSLKNYALGICGAICAALPCVSGMACCGAGEIIGIWALIVLMNADVRAAFR
jgi:hypothetical protein